VVRPCPARPKTIRRRDVSVSRSAKDSGSAPHLWCLISLTKPRPARRDDPVDTIIPACFSPFLDLESNRYRIISDDCIGSHNVGRVLVDKRTYVGTGEVVGRTGCGCRVRDCNQHGISDIQGHLMTTGSPPVSTETTNRSVRSDIMADLRVGSTADTAKKHLTATVDAEAASILSRFVDPIVNKRLCLSTGLAFIHQPVYCGHISIPNTRPTSTSEYISQSANSATLPIWSFPSRRMNSQSVWIWALRTLR
jgi:hypothetical protein